MKEVKETTIQDLISFYLHEKPDHAGRTVDDYLSFTDEYMEKTHDFIQWMFPVIGKSIHSATAPNLTPETCMEFHRVILTNPEANTTFANFISKFLSFLKIDRFFLFQKKEHVWYTHRNHNQLRISRFINCLGYSRFFIYRDLARELSHNLVIDKVSNGIITDCSTYRQSKLFWALSPRFQFTLKCDEDFQLEVKYRNKTILDAVRLIQSTIDIMNLKDVTLDFDDGTCLDKLSIKYSDII